MQDDGVDVVMVGDPKAAQMIGNPLVALGAYQDAVDRLDQARHQRKNMTRCAIVLGGILMAAKAAQDWDALSLSGWAEYCSDPQSGVGLDVSTADRWIQLYDVFVVQLGQPIDRLVDIPHSRLEELLGVVNAGNVDDLLQTAGTLSCADLRREVARMDGRRPDTKCVSQGLWCGVKQVVIRREDCLACDQFA